MKYVIGLLILCEFFLSFDEAHAQGNETELLNLWKSDYTVNFGSYKIWSNFSTVFIKKRKEKSKWILVNLSKLQKLGTVNATHIRNSKVVKDTFASVIDYFCLNADTVSVLFTKTLSDASTIFLKRYGKDTSIILQLKLPDNYQQYYKFDDYGLLPYSADKRYYAHACSTNEFFQINTSDPSTTIVYLSPVRKSGFSYYINSNLSYNIYSVTNSRDLSTGYQRVVFINDTMVAARLPTSKWQLLSLQDNSTSTLYEYDNIFLPHDTAGLKKNETIVALRNDSLFLLKFQGKKLLEAYLDVEYQGKVIDIKYFESSIFLKNDKALWQRFDTDHPQKKSAFVVSPILIPISNDYVLYQDVNEPTKYHLKRFENPNDIDDNISLGADQRFAFSVYTDDDEITIFLCRNNLQLEESLPNVPFAVYTRYKTPSKKPKVFYLPDNSPLAAKAILPYKAFLFVYSNSSWQIVPIDNIKRRVVTGKPLTTYKDLAKPEYKSLSFIIPLPVLITDMPFFIAVVEREGAEVEILLDKYMTEVQ